MRARNDIARKAKIAEDRRNLKKCRRRTSTTEARRHGERRTERESPESRSRCGKSLVKHLVCLASESSQAAEQRGGAMKKTISVTVNGVTHQSEVEPRMLLVQYIRDVLNLTGTH